MPRRSKRMWSIMPVSSGPCSSPGFTKPTNSQVSVAPAIWREGGYLSACAWSSQVLLWRGCGRPVQSGTMAHWFEQLIIKAPAMDREGSQVIDEWAVLLGYFQEAKDGWLWLRESNWLVPSHIMHQL